MTRSLTYIEIDVPDFVSGSPEADQTFRFARDADYLPRSIEAIPSVKTVAFSSPRISLGKNLGERASLTVQLTDHRHIFDDEDFNSGTFWGKWRARYGTRLRGRALRWIQGLDTQTLAQMDTRHYVIEEVSGPTIDGTYTIIAKDVLKLADPDRAQAPVLSNGFLTADITDADGSFTASPAGVGDLEYPASGYVAIGGEEIVEFTRSGDVFMITRGQLGTLAAAHEAGDRAQLVLRYSGEDPADIIYDLITNYTDIPASYLPLAAWQVETSSYLQRLYTATIPEPVSVSQLISELIQQAALAVWWEPLTQLVRLQVLRAIPTNVAQFDESNMIAGSIKIAEQPKTRISQVWTYFGQRNPLLPVDELDNYRSVAITVVGDDEELSYGSPAIHKITSRWIPFGGRQVALRLNDILIGRYKDPPRAVGFSTYRYGEIKPMLGGGYTFTATPIQDVTGAQATTPIQITRLTPKSDRYDVEAEEMLFEGVDQVDLVNRVITIDAGILNVNLRDLHDTIYPEPEDGGSPTINITCYIEEGAIVGSASTDLVAFDVGDWPADIPITIYVRGRIQGAGGDGGDATPNNEGIDPGEDGGDAFYTRKDVTVVLDEGDGEIWGGGGGGGGDFSSGATTIGGGGGGAGQIPGDGGASRNRPDGEPGTTEAGGDGEDDNNDDFGGDGGDPGQDGDNSRHNIQGGDAGLAVDGLSYITKVGAGDIRGSEVN